MLDEFSMATNLGGSDIFGYLKSENAWLGKKGFVPSRRLLDPVLINVSRGNFLRCVSGSRE